MSRVFCGWRTLLWTSIVAVGGPVYAVEVTLSGTVASSAGTSEVPRATVLCSDRDSGIEGLPVTVDAAGRFSLSTQLTQGVSHLTCKISAPGYLPVTKTTLVGGRDLDLGVVRLKRSSSLTIASVIRQYLNSRKDTAISVLVQNNGAEAIPVRRLDLSAVARATTECLDPRPTLIFDLSRNLALTVQSRRETLLSADIAAPEQHWNDTGAATITVEELGCRQKRIKMSLTYAFTVPAHSSSWFRFLLPRNLKAGDGKEVTVPIADWEGIEVLLGLVDGTEVHQSS